MRENLFRGLDKLYNVWRFGSLIEYDNGQVAIVACADRYGGAVFTNEVVPETVGQYTGLDDKNGVNIFEGDIVTAWSQGYQATGEVKQRIDGLWLMYPAYQHGKQWGLCPNPKGATTVEIIGNIHDNPELMEVGE